MHGRSLHMPRPADGRRPRAAPLSPCRVPGRRLLAVAPGRPAIRSRILGRAPVGARVGANPSTAKAASK
eukprot:6030326-Alexandrium_andersonii.AAC.1